MKVLKFGGTSLGKPERMHQVAKIVMNEQQPVIVVLSALSGTTNALVSIGEHIQSKSPQKAQREIEQLYEHYLDFYRALLKLEDTRIAALGIIDKHFDLLRSIAIEPASETNEKILLAQGELISTQLFSQYLNEVHRANVLLPALEYMAIDENDEPNMPYIEEKLNILLNEYSGDDLFITQGYICLDEKGGIDNLKRGGSDFTASLVGAAANANKIEIWTDIDGLHNNDPRVVDHTYPVANLSFNEASELAYFGAKILHPSSILPAKKYNIPVHLKNTMKPEALGTLISSQEKTTNAKAIAAKDNITAIKIKSTRMLLAYGFLRKIFDVFEKFKTPIDMITTSEVAVSLTVDDSSQLINIVTELEHIGEVTIDKKQTIICIVGNQIALQAGIVRDIFIALDQIPIRMISYGGSKYNVSVLIDTKNKKKALLAINHELFGID
ncbi:MAG: aspartate kinase [Epsilonproteobacteria bacterium]|nr:MAG: aspartate kinase [Campylobacterota bacterium]